MKRQAVDFDVCKYVIGLKWNKGSTIKKDNNAITKDISGREDEARECYKLFDKKEKGFINA